MSNELPIIFQDWGVNAILEGRKTQTRRVMTPHPPTGWRFDGRVGWINSKHPRQGRFGAFMRAELAPGKPMLDLKPSPYGKPGDLLWVREAWAMPKAFDLLSPKKVERMANTAGYTSRPRCSLWYRADGTFRRWCDELPNRGKWRPSIHMPKWATRIWLKVADVRAESVQDIKLSDIASEGIRLAYPDPVTVHDMQRKWAEVWNDINAKPKPVYDTDPFGNRIITCYQSFPWEDTQEIKQYKGKCWYVYGNPWVWVYNFEVTKVED